MGWIEKDRIATGSWGGYLHSRTIKWCRTDKGSWLSVTAVRARRKLGCVSRSSATLVQTAPFAGSAPALLVLRHEVWEQPRTQPPEGAPVSGHMRLLLENLAERWIPKVHNYFPWPETWLFCKALLALGPSPSMQGHSPCFSSVHQTFLSIHTPDPMLAPASKTKSLLPEIQLSVSHHSDTIQGSSLPH